MTPARALSMPRRLLAAALLALLLPGPAPAATALPAEVDAALRRAGVPAEAMGVVVLPADGGRPALALREHRPMNPASLAKLLTTIAALDLLGPSWTWSTPVWLAGPVHDGVLQGSLHIRGSGDPKLVIEQVWLMLRRVQQRGVREIRGDIVLDGSAFAAADNSPADFDGDTLRPYNVRPDALLLNFKAVTYGFAPDPAQGVARVTVEPALAGTAVDATVPLAGGPCNDWRSTLKAGFGDPAKVHFEGAYPQACGEQSWPVADPQPATYNARLLQALWSQMGGRLGGRVRNGPAPADQPPSFEHRSPPLLDVVRDINKFSNNVMAEQLFLSLALSREPARPAQAGAARALLEGWLAERLGEAAAGTVVDNGSGLSREARISPHALARLLQLAHDGPWMPELASSLPISGVDGTLRRARGLGGARAHLKTGSLRDVSGIAGYVLSQGGHRYVLVAIVNHPKAPAARPALDALVQWVMRDTPAR